jgi:hypothetical protein
MGWLGEEGAGLGALSVNGAYHFAGGVSARRWRPFLTGGFTLGSDSSTLLSLFNVGAGVNFWMKPDVGLRLEFRDYIWSDNGETAHVLGLRVCVAFR